MTLYIGNEMTPISTNLGGGVQTLAPAYTQGAGARCFFGSITFASQVSGSTFWMCRVPLMGIYLGAEIITDTSTGSTTLAIGDSNTAALFGAAAAYTSTNAPALVGKAAAMVQLTTGYDAQTGAQVTYSNNQGYGGLYDDIIITTAAATAPSSGNLILQFWYALV